MSVLSAATKNPQKNAYPKIKIIKIMLDIDCKCIGGEVFECGNLNELIERADVFFGIMP